MSEAAQGYLAIVPYVMVALVPVALAVFWRMVRDVEYQGARTRPDLFAPPDTIALMVFFGTVFIPVAVVHATGLFQPSKVQEPGTPMTVKNILESMGFILAPTIALLALIVMRGGSLKAIFGLGRIPLLKALSMGIVLAVLAFSLAASARVAVKLLFEDGEAPQKMVQSIGRAVSGGDNILLLVIAISAVVNAPFCEEVLFRGMFYPTLARAVGRIPSALITSVLFALIHDTYSDAPSLVILALCFTIGYEASGSLLVPIIMHAAFNSMSLFQQWFISLPG